LNQSSQIMKERIVQETTNLFLRKGFNGTTIKEITSAVGLTKGAIYWYFASKDELLETILDKWERTFLDGLIASDKAINGSFVEKFKQYHKYSTEFAVKHRELCVVWTTLTAEVAGSGLKAESRFRSVLDRYIEFVKGLIDKGKEEHAVKEELNSYILANVIIGMHNGILLQWYTKQGDVDGPQLARAFRSVLLSGITSEGE
jgi:AcrR family transcriptional regulator